MSGDERSQTLGSSEAAAAIGVSPWETRAQLAMRKIAERRGQWTPPAETDAMTRGKILEDVIARAYAMRCNIVLRQGEYRRAQNRPWQSATIDRLIEQPQPEIVEIKTAANHDGWGEPGTDQIPIYYLAQVMHQLSVWTECARARVVVLWGHHTTLSALAKIAQKGKNVVNAMADAITDDIAEYIVARDEKVIASLCDAEEKFWREWIESETIHEIDGEAETRRRLATIFPQRNRDIIRGGDVEAIAMRRMAELRAQSEKIEKEIGEIQNMLCLRIGAAAGISTDIGTLFWREISGRRRVDWEAVAKECDIPDDVIARHTTQGKPTRRVEFRLATEE